MVVTMTVSSEGVNTMTKGRMATWRQYGRHGRLAASFEAVNRDDAERKHARFWKLTIGTQTMTGCVGRTHATGGACVPTMAFLVRGVQEYWSAVMAESVGDEDSDYGADTVWRVHPDCVGHRHLSEKEARMCAPKAHDYMRRVGRTLIYET